MRSFILLAFFGLSTSFACAAPAPNSVPPKRVPPGMVLVPAGSFQMGSDDLQEGLHNQGDAAPLHRVELRAFYIDTTEVTNAQYKKYCDSTHYSPPPHWNKNTFAAGQAQLPVTHVNWYEAAAYARWLGKRLPSEAEWEKAARGTDSRFYPWGNAWDPARVVWNQNAPQPVGQKPTGASPYGALDMAGNVDEWVADWYRAYPGAVVKMPEYGTRYKVIRGGGFDGLPYDATTFHRLILPPQSRSEWCGFRCALSVDAKATSKSTHTK